MPGCCRSASWRPIPAADWPWLAGTGLAGALGQFWITDAFRRAPPAVVAPFEYTSILWAFAIDWIFWSASPSSSLMLGAAIVIATGIYVIWDERIGLADESRQPAALRRTAGRVQSALSVLRAAMRSAATVHGRR